MADLDRLVSLEELPSHLILEILTSGRFSAADLACLEQTCRIFRGNHGIFAPECRSFIEFAAFQLCCSDPIFGSLLSNARKELFDRCSGNWKRVLRFLHSVEQSSNMVETSAGNMQITTGRYHTLLVSDSSVYCCGSNLCGVLGQGPDTTQCVAFSRISFPSSSQVIHVSASHNHAAFVMQSGEVFTCGDNSSFCCGYGDVRCPIFRPRLVEGLKGIQCKQVATGFSFTVFLTRQGHVYTCGINTHGQLGHGDTLDRPTPKIVELLEGIGCVVQIAAGPTYSLAVTSDGTVYSFGSCLNFCLGHGEQHNEFQPRAIQSLKRKGIHVLRVSAGDEHVVALDSSGFVYTWGRGYCGALGHGDEIDKTTPEILSNLKGYLAIQTAKLASADTTFPRVRVLYWNFQTRDRAMFGGLEIAPAVWEVYIQVWKVEEHPSLAYTRQVCARKRKSFVLMENGSVFGFGWMGFGSLGFSDRGTSDKVMKPRVLDSLQAHHISQISTGLYHTVLVTSRGLIFGFGDNERAQLGHDSLRGCLRPTEIVVQEAKTALVAESI